MIQQDLAELKCDLKQVQRRIACYKDQLTAHKTIMRASYSILDKEITYLKSQLHRKNLSVIGIDNLPN